MTNPSLVSFPRRILDRAGLDRGCVAMTRNVVRACVLVSVGLVGCRERLPSRGTAPSATASSAHSVALPNPVAEHFDPGPLNVTLRLAGKDYFELEFVNGSSEELIVLRPGQGEYLAAPPSGVGTKVFPSASYRFEARALRGARVFRDVYRPQWFWMSPVDSANAARAKGTNDKVTDDKERIPAKGKLTLTVDLPFQLEPNDYELRFWYQYFLSPGEVPAKWYAGEAAAPPLLLSVAANGDLSVRNPAAAQVLASPSVDLTLVEVSPGTTTHASATSARRRVWWICRWIPSWSRTHWRQPSGGKPSKQGRGSSTVAASVSTPRVMIFWIRASETVRVFRIQNVPCSSFHRTVRPAYASSLRSIFRTAVTAYAWPTTTSQVSPKLPPSG